jgi:diguanylate cyclase (GGDEF)-like protein
MIFFMATLITTKRELRSTQKRQLQLEALNRLLNQEQVKLEEKLIRDPLTGLFNRSGLMPIFNSIKDATPLSLIFIDIDHFKKVNDTLGHNEGDRVLVMFTNLLSESTRSHDLLARWGGEELVLACPDTTLENAVHIAEKLRINITRHEWPKGLHVTASFGVAQLLPDESPTDFIARADRALYTAKAQGRNCVRTSEPAPQK